eukprot:Selendium_serpulae@DN5082_c0_g1_i1.p1
MTDDWPKGCDTFVAYPPTTATGHVLFGKNSDRPAGEGQTTKTYAAADHDRGANVKCTYLSIPQAGHTLAVLVSQIDWMWGCEHGANECGVAIGNEAVWTRVAEEPGGPHLLGMDLVRLGLERGRSSRAALDVITRLLEAHGQGGACAENDPSFTYHNSFLIADVDESFVLETAGRHWVAQRWASGGRNISNGLTIRTDFDLSSEGIKEYAKESGLWKGEEDSAFDFAKIFSQGGVDTGESGRQGGGRRLLEQHANSSAFGRDEMISILRDHRTGICMHGPFETTAAMVTELFRHKNASHWMTGPHPCKSTFSLQEFPEQ